MQPTWSLSPLHPPSDHGQEGIRRPYSAGTVTVSVATQVCTGGGRSRKCLKTHTIGQQSPNPTWPGPAQAEPGPHRPPMGQASSSALLPRKRTAGSPEMGQGSPPKGSTQVRGDFSCSFFADTAQLPSQGGLERELLSPPFQSVGVAVNRGSPSAPVWCSYYSTVVPSFVSVLL